MCCNEEQTHRQADRKNGCNQKIKKRKGGSDEDLREETKSRGRQWRRQSIIREGKNAYKVKWINGVNEREEYEELDFGWTEINESQRPICHDFTIPSAGMHFQWGQDLPDLHFKVITKPILDSYPN